MTSEEIQRKQRAAARWKILRSALLGEGVSSATKRASIHRFDGFQMLPRRKVENVDADYTATLRTLFFPSSLNGVRLEELKCSIETAQQCYSLWKNQPEGIILRLHTSCVDIVVEETNALSVLQKRLSEVGITFKSETSKSTDSDGADSHHTFIIANDETTAMETFVSPYEYDIPNQNSDTLLRVRTRERMKSVGKIDLKALTSHRHYGVDNTGNACVWDSEATLTYCLMQACWGESTIVSKLGVPNLFRLASTSSTLRVVELGAGMAGIAGLALKATELSGLSGETNISVVLTDGHPDAVENNRINSRLTTALYPKSSRKSSIASTHLLWRDNLEGSAECSCLVTDNQGPFDLCLASDCTHFQEFHAALMLTIARLLRIDGVAILCQPHRSNSLKRFMALIDCINQQKALWEVSLLEDYDEEISRRHKNCLENDSSYEPSIHFPNLLLLRKLREVDEDFDREIAVKHMLERDQ